MNSRFNIIITVAYRIQSILKAAFQFMFQQMTKSKSNSLYIVDFDSDRIMAIKKRIRKRPHEFQYVTFEDIVATASSCRRLGSYLFHLIITKGKKEFLKKLCLVLK